MRGGGGRRGWPVAGGPPGSRARAQRWRAEPVSGTVRGADGTTPADRAGGGAYSLTMRHVAIIGTGLIGASFGLALRKNGFSGAITGVSSARAIDDAVACGAIDRGASLEE